MLQKQAPSTDTRHEDKAKFGEVHRSAAKKGAGNRERRRTDNDLRNGGNICFGVAVLRTLRGVSSFTGQYARSRCRETCPTSMCACIGIHYPRPLFARRCRLAASRVPFSARSFLVHGETSAAAARRWTAAGTPLLVRGRCSPSEVLPRLPITRASFCLSHSSLRFSVFRPYGPLSLSFRPLSSCLLGFSLTFSRYRPPARSCFYLSLRPRFPLSPDFDLFYPVTNFYPRANFLHSFERFGILYFSFSIIEHFRSYQVNVSSMVF